MHNGIAGVVDSQNQDRRARHKHERIDETEYSKERELSTQFLLFFRCSRKSETALQRRIHENRPGS